MPPTIINLNPPDPRFSPITRATGIIPLTIAAILMAWHAEELTEGQVAELLAIDRLALRELRDEMIREGVEAAAVRWPGLMKE